MEMIAAEPDPVRNPDWTRDETILLMDLYLHAPRAGKSHPEVVALSALLRAAGHRGSRPRLATFRNPTGIAMRLRNFGKLDPEAPPGRDVGWRPGSSMDAAIWREFGEDRGGLAREVERIHQTIALDGWQQGKRSSRGPVPSFGARTAAINDAKTAVYLLLISGSRDVLIPGIPPKEGCAVVKVGRTANLPRRMAELASGLPPSASIRHIPIGLRSFSSAETAHAFERSILDLSDSKGWSLGGEFVYAPLSELRSAFNGPFPNR